MVERTINVSDFKLPERADCGNTPFAFSYFRMMKSKRSVPAIRALRQFEITDVDRSFHHRSPPLAGSPEYNGLGARFPSPPGRLARLSRSARCLRPVPEIFSAIGWTWCLARPGVAAPH